MERVDRRQAAGAQGEGWTGGTEGYVKQGQDGQGRRGQEGR